MAGMSPHDEPFISVFSTEKVTRLGTGATACRVTKTVHYLTLELGNGSFEIQELNALMLPSGPKDTISRDELLAKYLPEPEVYHKQVLPQMEKLTSALAWGDRYRRQEKYFSAETEYDKALALDQDNVRATFGIGICYVTMRNMDKAQTVFQKLVTMDAAFLPKHKHLFNEFGIALRKAEMYPQAMEYYGRALTWDPKDENLLYNLARAAYQLGDMTTAAERAGEALDIRPDFPEAQEIMGSAQRKLKHAAPPVMEPAGDHAQQPGA